MIVCFVVQIAIVIVMYTVNARENKRRDLVNPNGPEDQHATAVSLGLSDTTDEFSFSHKSFRPRGERPN
ncbi:unnamed protein product [Penicillium camemberti]|uniref:Str. FM013 n=1 Tax=Penicillium camemberti (strain FM 013) TaxID=1429867 RepID=A0A0G4NWE2_PENC3|nr:unnamed protein product [Penicillium camemberti]